MYLLAKTLNKVMITWKIVGCLVFWVLVDKIIINLVVLTLYFILL